MYLIAKGVAFGLLTLHIWALFCKELCFAMELLGIEAVLVLYQSNFVYQLELALWLLCYLVSLIIKNTMLYCQCLSE